MQAASDIALLSFLLLIQGIWAQSTPAPSSYGGRWCCNIQILYYGVPVLMLVAVLAIIVCMRQSNVSARSTTSEADRALARRQRIREHALGQLYAEAFPGSALSLMNFSIMEHLPPIPFELKIRGVVLSRGMEKLNEGGHVAS
ncbi:hypothetical protein GUITHDRAFT_163783 [Guillardia theta CCMP2712]|uniref:Uncharacterized protein n=3 Tax=Guillardia theta TaxID=55529 RepID=L1J620_GUITC|nr:hypothetical protein GUITHDRAFT_163783 [Guillardia theta CCMP2712]EKX43535.1 hypothetical protein GUITHDRAFT_163783 [Guillardia theta CCMP2712]|eukprot:XP_005830515.1 hypothetical protein GUITHDRAFT_163783 [Guillardia theta CCMP2712]